MVEARKNTYTTIPKLIPIYLALLKYACTYKMLYGIRYVLMRVYKMYIKCMDLYLCKRRQYS